MSSTARDNVIRFTRPHARRIYRRRPPPGVKLSLYDARTFLDSLETRFFDADDDGDETVWPDMTEADNFLSLAKMSFNAYSDPTKIDSTDWYDLGDQWAVNSSFGWENMGVRGHVFTDPTRSLIVVSFKGTSAGLRCGNLETCVGDKFNDNHMFSCCTARIDWKWRPVYECGSAQAKICNSTCVESKMRDGELYYWAAAKIVDEIIEQNPRANIWLTGHSLGGSVAALVGHTFGQPTVTFEAPGEKHAATRLHVMMEPALPAEDTPVWHVGHNADPIYEGTCNQYGAISYCYSGGYDMESKCHTGRRCVFDVIERMGEKLDIRKHSLGYVIENLIKRWNWEEWKEPECVPQADCEDCDEWVFVH